MPIENAVKYEFLVGSFSRPGPGQSTTHHLQHIRKIQELSFVNGLFSYFCVYFSVVMYTKLSNSVSSLSAKDVKRLFNLQRRL